MRIVHIASEFAPIAKAGGLGEVIVGLSRNLSRSGHYVDVIVPKYHSIDPSKLKNLHIEVPEFKCLEHSNSAWSASVEECHLHLLEMRHPAGYFDREAIYGYEDDIARFIYFSRAALEYLKGKNEPIDILHLHDWHVSLCAPLVRDLFKTVKVHSIVLSIHNAEYQGKCAAHDLDQIGLNGASYLTKEKLQDNNLKFPQTINLLKGGIVYSDAIIPVSPSYAQEILTPEYGFHLDATFRKRKEAITGILNGIDTTLWDPEKDPHVAAHYAVESMISGKEKNRESFPLDKTKRPWVGAVTRLVPQKGPELIEAAIKKTLDLGGSFLLLGSSPMPELQAHFNQLKEKYRGNPQVFLRYEYDEALAHRIYAALDLLIVPSHFEPCGLTQLIGMRYGTVPIVRETGGLRDTVFDCEDPKIPIGKRNGFTFRSPTPASMNHAIERAFLVFKSEPPTFKLLMKRGMEADFSWEKPGKEYLKLYRKLLLSEVDRKTAFA